MAVDHNHGSPVDYFQAVIDITFANRLASLPKVPVSLHCSERREPEGLQTPGLNDSQSIFDPCVLSVTNLTVEAWHDAAVVKVWTGRIAELDAASGITTEVPSNSPRYVGASGMQTVCDHLTAELAVRSGVEVQEVNRIDAGWLLVDVNGKTIGPFDSVVVATPPFQAAALLREVPRLAYSARSVPMSPCWTVMVAFSDTILLPADGAVVRSSALSWIARNSSKGHHNENPDCWVLQASAEWSRQHLEDTKQAVEELMLSAFFDATGCSKRTGLYVESHRWRYATCVEPLATGCLVEP